MTVTYPTERDLAVAGLEARAIVQGGLTLDHTALDDLLRALLGHGREFSWLTTPERAHLAAAYIRGHVVTHPTPTPAEQTYGRLLESRRRLAHHNRAARTMARAIRSALTMADDFRRACATPPFAHPVHNSVENDTAVIQGPDGLQYEIISHDGTVVRQIPW